MAVLLSGMSIFLGKTPFHRSEKAQIIPIMPITSSISAFVTKPTAKSTRISVILSEIMDMTGRGSVQI